MDDLFSALRDFKNVFTVKRVVTMLIVALALLVVCAPQHEPATEDGGACDGACPFPRPAPVITVPATVITTIARDNWSFTLMDEGWVSHEPSIPEIKVVMVNESQGCMVLLIKEQTDVSLPTYVVESSKGFVLGGGNVLLIKQVTLNKQKFVLLGGKVSGEDMFWSWNGIKNGFGYSFSCFCSADADGGLKCFNTCQAVADTLQIE